MEITIRKLKKLMRDSFERGKNDLPDDTYEYYLKTKIKLLNWK